MTIKSIPDWPLDLPDELLSEAYGMAATRSVLAAVNPKIFFGFFSVCADGVGHGPNNSFPSLDGHQMSDALLFLGQGDVVKANWDYVRSFQRPDGQLPLAILPDYAGKEIGTSPFMSVVDANGGLYRHWVPGDPLRTLAAPSYIQNADVIFKMTLDRRWLADQLPSVNRTADHLASMITAEGAVGGAGYYVERPTRIEYDGVSQCHAADAFRRLAALNDGVGDRKSAERYRSLAVRITRHFQTRFWMKDRFAEYIHPERGPVNLHGLTDTDWSAIALGMATPEQTAILWPQLKNEPGFYYGGMPAGIATHPETYESWEFSYDDRMDLAAMGRVWYLECQARARMGDGEGLVGSLRRVAATGRKNDYYWWERYNEKGGYGAAKYCEYPANLIRIIQRFLFGVEYNLDGSVTVAPTMPETFWQKGFGQTLAWRNRRLSYRMSHEGITGVYCGKETQNLRFRLRPGERPDNSQATVDGKPMPLTIDREWMTASVPPAPSAVPFRIAIG